jgi:hypothetical protein
MARRAKQKEPCQIESGTRVDGLFPRMRDLDMAVRGIESKPQTGWREGQPCLAFWPRTDNDESQDDSSSLERDRCWPLETSKTGVAGA